MSGVLTKIMPARSASESPRLIADLDELAPKPMAFRLQGKTYQIKIGTVRRLAELSDRFEQVLSLLNRKAAGEIITDFEVYRAYHSYISVLCPELTMDVVMRMTMPQLTTLLKEIIRYATGQQLGETPDLEKKKTIA